MSVEEQRGKNEYFDGEFERAKQFLKQNPDLKETYNKFKGREKDRNTGKNFYDIVTPERWKLVSGDNTGRLYNFLKDEALKSNQKDGKPIDPVFQLPTSEQQKLVMDLRSRPTGDDIETEEILRATQGWYSKFEQAERDYYAENTKFYEGKELPDTQGERMKAYGAIKYPEQPSLITQYYQTKATNPDAAKGMFETTNLSDQFDAYKQQRLDYINAKRKIEGVPPISESAFNNVTFGYEDDERKVFNELKYGKGYGGFGNYKKKPPTAGSAYKYAISPNAGGQGARPTVRVAKSSKRPRVSARAGTKPTVTLKKSLV